MTCGPCGLVGLMLSPKIGVVHCFLDRFYTREKQDRQNLKWNEQKEGSWSGVFLLVWCSRPKETLISTARVNLRSSPKFTCFPDVLIMRPVIGILFASLIYPFQFHPSVTSFELRHTQVISFNSAMCCATWETSLLLLRWLFASALEPIDARRMGGGWQGRSSKIFEEPDVGRTAPGSLDNLFQLNVNTKSNSEVTC